MNESLRCAAIKLRRALNVGEDGGVPIDPVSGYSAPEIVRWLIDQGPAGERIVVAQGVRDLVDVRA
jgi:hypothetical protein